MARGATNEGLPVRATLVQPRQDPRCTRVGRVLRRFHLDELPQLYNVLAGDMAPIGPRPLVPVEDAIISRVWAERSNELPGITGAWQVGRSEQTTVAELIQLDRAHLAHRSARRDLTRRGAHAVVRCERARQMR
jgi:lipopolysaccharide/colanic/teichoic acid biosynthesis glycosyltransferase